MLEKFLLAAGVALVSCTVTPQLARSLGYRDIPIGIVPHPSQPDLVLLQQGQSSGIRIGDRGVLTLQGYAVTETARFEATTIPFTVVSVGATSATARLPVAMQSLEPIAANIQILDIQLDDLHPPRPNLPVVESRLANASDAIDPAQHSSTASSGVSNSDASQSEELSGEVDWGFDAPSVQLCGDDIGGPFSTSTPDELCARVTRDDLLVQAIVSGQRPSEVLPSDAIGAAVLHRNDRRLMDVVRFHFLRPGTPRSRVAIAQEYLRFHHYQQAADWLTALHDTEISDETLADAAIHARMYAAYQSGDYDTTIAEGDSQIDATTDRLNLVAAAHYQQQNYDAAVDILESLPPLAEVLNNRAIAHYYNDRPLLEECESDDPCLSAEETIEFETQRQQQARPLLDGIGEPEVVPLYNRTVLDIQQQQLSAAMDTLLSVHTEVTTGLDTAETDASPYSAYDPALNQLKLELLQYVSNHDESMAYLAELSWNGGAGLPSELGDAIGLAGSFSGVGSFLPLALFNLVSYATEQEREAALIEVIQLDLTALYAGELDLIPLVEAPPPISINPFAVDTLPPVDAAASDSPAGFE